MVVVVYVFDECAVATEAASCTSNEQVSSSGSCGCGGGGAGAGAGGDDAVFRRINCESASCAIKSALLSRVADERLLILREVWSVTSGGRGKRKRHSSANAGASTGSSGRQQQQRQRGARQG